jgi:hypothetical protein
LDTRQHYLDLASQWECLAEMANRGEALGAVKPRTTG